MKAFPALFDAVANGELHLTGLLMIGPHLTASNQHEVLARAKHRTKKELAKLVRELDPLPDVPARIAPLGPAEPPRNHLRNPTWTEFMAAMVPVNHLKPGERPREWIDEPTIAKAFEQSASTSVVAPARVKAAVTGPQRHSIQFTATQEYADLLERAKALLSHTGGTSFEELHLRAMQCLVAQLEKRRYGAPRREVRLAEDGETHPISGSAELKTRDDAGSKQGGDERAEARGAEETGPALQPETPQSERTRNIPARIRRRVFERDGAQCTFVDDSGCRCHEVDRLEIHHLKPFALYGQHHADNLALRCQAHNALAAEQDFGRQRMLEKRDSAPHESLRSQQRSGD